MDMAYINIIMVIDLKVNGKMIKKMVKDFTIMLRLVMFMKDYGKTMLSMVMVNIDIVMEICILETI